MKKAICHDCGVKEGEYHHPGCDMERCPFCGGQLISCDCAYKLLNIDVSEGTWAYEYGLTPEQEQQWDSMLKDKGLIPYVQIPYICPLCGELYPIMFNVPDKTWQKYIIPSLQGEALCRACYDRQVKLFPNGWRNVKEV